MSKLTVAQRPFPCPCADAKLWLPLMLSCAAPLPFLSLASAVPQGTASRQELEDMLTEEAIDEYIANNRKDLEDMVSGRAGGGGGLWKGKSDGSRGDW